MSNLSKTAKVIIRNIAILGAVEIAAGIVLIIALFNATFIPGHVLGVIFGSLVSVLRVMHLEKSINKSMELADKVASVRYFRLRYFLRILMTIAAIVVALLLNPFMNFISAAVGLFNMTLGAYIYKLFNSDTPSTGIGNGGGTNSSG